MRVLVHHVPSHRRRYAIWFDGNSLPRTCAAYVDYGTNRKTLAEGVVHGTVATQDHKTPEMIDQNPAQLAREGHTPTRFADDVPRKWQQAGVVRKKQLAPHAFLEIVREHKIKSEQEALVTGGATFGCCCETNSFHCTTTPQLAKSILFIAQLPHNYPTTTQPKCPWCNENYCFYTG